MVVPSVSPAAPSEGTRQGLGMTAVPGNAPAPAAAPLAEEEEEEEEGGCLATQHRRAPEQPAVPAGALNTRSPPQ